MRANLFIPLFSGSAPAVSVDPLVNDWYDRITANGGTISQSTIDATTTFVTSLRSAGLLTKFRMLNLMAGTNIAAMTVPLITNIGSAVHNAVAMVSGDYSEATGAKTDGSTKYIDTGFAPDGAAIGGISAYLRTAIAGAANVLIGCRDSGNTQVYRLIRSGVQSVGQFGGAVDQAQVTDTANTPAALYHVSRTGATSLALYRNGASVASSSVSTTPVAIASSMYVLAQNPGGSPSGFSPNNTYIAGYAVDDGTLSAGDALSYYNILQTFQTSLGRQV